MNRIYYIGGAIILAGILIMCTSSGIKGNSKADMVNSAADGFVVMELFTSQGCSSCPAADAVLETYAEKKDEHIIPLAFHVDYWNRLGWIDSLSKSDYSDRQRNYAEKLNSEPYTPQLVINGQQQFIGSNRSAIASAVNKYLKTNATVKITVADMSFVNSKAAINYNIEGDISNMNINAALVQKSVVTQIKGGENRGVNLNNFNVVRDFKTSLLSTQSGSVSLKLPAGNNFDNYMVVLFMQDKNNGSIKAAVSKNCK
ncbi:MAG: DUF1223 domain-containing protein [Ferruginibacter sp.]